MRDLISAVFRQSWHPTDLVAIGVALTEMSTWVHCPAIIPEAVTLLWRTVPFSSSVNRLIPAANRSMTLITQVHDHHHTEFGAHSVAAQGANQRALLTNLSGAVLAAIRI